MKKRIAALLLSTVMAFSLTACGNSAKTEKADNKETKQTTEAVEDMSFDEMVDAAKGTTVTFYGWGGDDSLNDWLDNYYAPRLKEKYDITLERVPMDIDAILSQLSGEISQIKDGDIDMIWINGENFKTCKENNTALRTVCRRTSELPSLILIQMMKRQMQTSAFRLRDMKLHTEKHSLL